MKIHEYQSKAILERCGIQVPRGFLAKTAQEAVDAFDALSVPLVMVKVQVLAGGRGKAGGIKKATTAEQARNLTSGFIGERLKTYQGGADGELIKAVWIEAGCNFGKELYMGIVLDRVESRPSLIFSECGGMDIEEVAKSEPKKVQTIGFWPSEGVTAQTFLDKLNLSAELEPYRAAIADTAAKLANIFIHEDCSLIEINPLVTIGDSAVMALDAKMAFDDSAIFRHSDWEALRDPDEDDAKEQRAKKVGLNYISLGGNVGCLVNGAGLAMATMDAVKNAGGEPSNFLDVGGGATKEAVQEGFSIMLEDPQVRAIMVNIFGGIMQCDIIANALVDASKALNLQIPVIIRIEGTNVEAGREILKNSGLAFHSAKNIDEAAQLAVELAGKN